ncbi:MAG: hypothetical protein ACYC6R_12555, partial [Anaerolineales bacterium]
MTSKMFLRRVYYALLLTLLASCASPTSYSKDAPDAAVPPSYILVTQDPNASPTPTPFQPSGQIDTALPTFTQTAPATVTSTSTPTLTDTPPPPT